MTKKIIVSMYIQGYFDFCCFKWWQGHNRLNSCGCFNNEKPLFFKRVILFNMKLLWILHLLKISVHFTGKGLLFSILSSKSFKYNISHIPTITSFSNDASFCRIYIALTTSGNYIDWIIWTTPAKQLQVPNYNCIFKIKWLNILWFRARLSLLHNQPIQ